MIDKNYEEIRKLKDLMDKQPSSRVENSSIRKPYIEYFLYSLRMLKRHLEDIGIRMGRIASE